MGGPPGMGGHRAFPTHNSGGVLTTIRTQVSPAHAPAPAPSSLPTTIPTYDDTSLSPAKAALPQPKATPTPPKATVEKEAAMVAAQAVASKLQEMQVAKEEERRRRKEQKMAERLAAQLTEQVPPVEEQVQEAGEVSRGGGRILDMVERQEGRAREGGQEDRREAKQRRKRKEKDSPLLITLKPFYRPNEKNGKKKKAARELTEAEEAALEESFVPRSPVPLPDSSGLKPSLVKPYLGVKIPGYANSLEKKAKGVRYADGVLPGQGSPDHGQARNTPPPPLPLPPRKRYKKVILTIFETHDGDTESDEESPPPPPPGSPPRYRMAELIQMFGQPRPAEAASA